MPEYKDPIETAGETYETILQRRSFRRPNEFYEDLHPMVRQKQRLLVSAPRRKKRRSGALEVGFPRDDGWVVVKKQKVTILIPALPVTEQLRMPNPEKCALSVNLRNTSNTELECSDKSYSEKPSISEREKSVSMAPESGIPTAKTVHPVHSVLVPRTSNQRHSISSENPEINNRRVQNSVGVFSAVKVRKQALIIGDGKLILNPRMRALNIEKKLQRAGGLNSWLVSLGLERFIKMFQQRNVNKFQLANLTMKKLKDMGAFAVGPRRKLMHAIDCLCQPYCFERL